MKRILVILALGGGIALAAAHRPELERRMEGVLNYAADHPGTFWTAGAVLALVIVLSLTRTR